MALDQNATLLTNLIDPEVIGDMLDKKLVNAIKFAPIAIIDDTLVGRPGDKVKLPYYSYIGDAVVVAEGEDIPIRQLSQSTKEVEIKKYGNGVQITDEAVLSGYGDPVGNGVDQIALSIASALDNALVSEADTTTNTFVYTGSAGITADNIADALGLFGEDLDGDKYLFINPIKYAGFRKADDWLPASDVAADLVIKGTVGMTHGCVVVASSRVPADKAFIVKPGALAIFMKRDVMVESDRDIINKSTVLTGDKHCAAYLIDESKAIRISKLNVETSDVEITAGGDDVVVKIFDASGTVTAVCSDSTKTTATVATGKVTISAAAGAADGTVTLTDALGNTAVINVDVK